MSKREFAERYTTRSRAFHRGFTLIELLLVMVILVVLAGLIAPKFINRADDARIAAAKTDLTSIATVLDIFKLDCNRFPTAAEGLQALVTDPGVKGWKGPYLKGDLPKDPWDNPYRYKIPSEHGLDYDLSSAGPDGQDGSDDDITNWKK